MLTLTMQERPKSFWDYVGFSVLGYIWIPYMLTLPVVFFFVAKTLLLELPFVLAGVLVAMLMPVFGVLLERRKNRRDNRCTR